MLHRQHSESGGWRSSGMRRVQDSVVQRRVSGRRALRRKAEEDLLDGRTERSKIALIAVCDREEKACLRKGRKTPRARAEVMADMAFSCPPLSGGDWI